MARLSSAQRRVQLVDAAIRVMTREGIAKATTRAIVAEAGVSLSVFHYCFESKQELFEAVIATLTEHSASPAMAAADLGPDATLRDTVRASLQAYWDHVVANPDEHMLTYELTQYVLRQPGLEDVAHRQYRQYVKANRDVVEQVQKQFGFELSISVSDLARYLASTLDGLTLNYLVLGNKASAERILDALSDQVVTYVRATRA
ncbi:TetR/AcrR family transcriptional regulator [Solicola gregarius]|uniref:TetR/AcrR family transcriptional regulator n=1 Tax=Solicola gregarius TaxID=2908642 RepID=A0AA46TDS4_9ACTN|nr:TetR/AcrR family transcriptional regulator [Solicola gregarius]UYM03421.1 TetR/AcrR family transcriptional regulator [Solicola gregarius]